MVTVRGATTPGIVTRGEVGTVVVVDATVEVGTVVVVDATVEVGRVVVVDAGGRVS